MSEQPYCRPKSPFKSQRASITDPSPANDSKSRVSTQQLDLDCVCPPNDTTPEEQLVLNTPTRLRSAVPTTSQPQKQSALNTPTNSVCKTWAASTHANSLGKTLNGSSTLTPQRPLSVRDKTPAVTPINASGRTLSGNSTSNTPQRPLSARYKESAASTPTNTLGKTQTGGSTLNTPQRPLSARDNTNQFNPAVTSTPRAIQMKVQQALSTVGNNQKRPEPLSTMRQPQRPVVPVQPLCKCVPIRDLTSEYYAHEKQSAQPLNRVSDGVKTDCVLKVEILSVRGGSLYDVDAMHSTNPPAPEYDPCYDVDPMVVKPASVQMGDSGVSSSEKRKVSQKRSKPTSVQEDDEDTLVPQSSDEGSTLHRETDSTLSPDSTSSEPTARKKRVDLPSSDESEGVIRSAHAVPRPLQLSEISLPDLSSLKEPTDSPEKRIGLPSKEDSDGVMRSPPAVPALSNLSEISLPDMSLVKEGKEGKSTAIPKPPTAGTRTPPGLGDDNLRVGAVSLPGSDLSGVTDVDSGPITRMTGHGRNDDDAHVRATGRETGQVDSDQSAQRTSSGQALTHAGRRSISLILGPSVRNFARLAWAPLIALRTLLGPVSNGRPELNARHARRKHFRRYCDEQNSSECGRIRSVRSAVVVTPYEATVSSLGPLLRRLEIRRNDTRNIPTDTSRSAASSEE